MKKIGDLYQKMNDSAKVAEESADAAVAADAKADQDRQSANSDRSSFSVGLAKIGPITMVADNGTFITCHPMTNPDGSAAFRAESSKGVDATFDDDPPSSSGSPPVVKPPIVMSPVSDPPIVPPLPSSSPSASSTAAPPQTDVPIADPSANPVPGIAGVDGPPDDSLKSVTSKFLGKPLPSV